MSNPRGWIVAAALALAAGEGRAASVSALTLLAPDAPGARLSVGAGDAALSVRVDAFGRLFEATYDPVGAATAGSVIALDCSGDVCRDAPDALPGGYVAFRNARGGFDPVGDVAQTVDAAPTAFRDIGAKSAESLFRLGDLEVSLVQTLSQAVAVTPSGDPVGAAIGARLTQSFTVTNRGAAAADVGFARLLDADLGWNDTVTPDLATGFDDSPRDDGGVTVIDGVRYLFQADPPEGAPDARGSNAREPSFVGVAAAFEETPAGLAPGALRETFEIADRPARLDEALRAGVGLYDADHAGEAGRILGAAATGEPAFVDVARDLAMALVNDLEGLGAGRSATYVTHTVFGAVKGVAPGDVEASPLLPDAATDEDGFAFTLAAEDILERQTIFIDPPVAVGYVYVVEGGATVYSVTAPTRAAVPDADGYRLFFDGATDGLSLAPGETVILAAQGVTTFRIEGIDAALMLDPDNPTAFVTGVALEGLAALRRTGDGAIRITQTPIVIDGPDVAPVPLPAPAALLLGAMGLLVWRGRRGRLPLRPALR